MKIPQEIIDQVLQATDIAEVVGQKVVLRKLGANHKGLCPFHQEKSPSFTVSQTKQIYHCFGCGEGGNAIGFIMKVQGLNFPEAVRQLAANAGITIPESGSVSISDPKEAYYKVNAYANWFFQQQLTTHSSVQAYLAKRGISTEIREKFELGYAPDSFEMLCQFLQGKGVPQEKALDLGLVKPGQRGGSYDFYRDRVIFPIHGARGRIIGFGGRTLKAGDEAKYINSPESPVYHKGSELYGLHLAKSAIAKTRRVFVVEGYIDAIACVQLGLENTVAPLGTALTTTQVQVLQRLTDRIVLMFDGDGAGQKAALKGFDTCLSVGVHPELVILPGGRDPGDYLTANGAELIELAGQAISAMDWVLAEAAARAPRDVAGRVREVRDVLDWIKRLPDAMERAAYRERVSRVFGMAIENIDKNIEIKSNFARPHKRSEATPLETAILCLYIRDPLAFPPGGVAELAVDFEDARLAQLASFFGKQEKKDETFDRRRMINQALAELPGELQGILSQVLLREAELPKESDIDSCLKGFLRQKNRRRLREISARILQAETANDAVGVRALLAEKQKLVTELNKTES
jgi:DNA primase